MGLDRDPGTLDFFEGGIVLLHWVQVHAGTGAKKGRGGLEKREREKGRGSLWTV